MSIPIGLLFAMLALGQSASVPITDQNSETITVGSGQAIDAADIVIFDPSAFYPKHFTFSSGGKSCDFGEFMDSADALYGHPKAMSEYEWQQTRVKFLECLAMCIEVTKEMRGPR